jgi:hypothetical protein
VCVRRVFLSYALFARHSREPPSAGAVSRPSLFDSRLCTAGFWQEHTRKGKARREQGKGMEWKNQKSVCRRKERNSSASCCCRRRFSTLSSSSSRLVSHAISLITEKRWRARENLVRIGRLQSFCFCDFSSRAKKNAGSWGEEGGKIMKNQ